MFDFIQQHKLNKQHFNQEIQWIIPAFIPQESAILLYAKGGTGKSFVATALTCYTAKLGMNVIYLDYDNSLITLIERDVQHKLIDLYPNIHYIHRASSQLTSEEMLDQLQMQAVGGKFKNTVLVIDSLKNFGDITNDKKASELMKKITNIRDAGATVIILSHTNKSESNYQGSNNIRDAVDCMYRVEKIDSQENELRFILNSEKERLPVKDTAISVRVNDYEMMVLDINAERMTPEEKEFIEKTKAILIKLPGANKKQILEECGFDKRDKTANNRLETYTGIYWQATQKGNVYHYSLIES